MVGVPFVIIWDDSHEAIFDFANVFSGRKIDAVGNSENVCVDRNCGDTKGSIENNVGRFTADSG